MTGMPALAAFSVEKLEAHNLLLQVWCMVWRKYQHPRRICSILKVIVQYLSLSPPFVTVVRATYTRQAYPQLMDMGWSGGGARVDRCLVEPVHGMHPDAQRLACNRHAAHGLCGELGVVNVALQLGHRLVADMGVFEALQRLKHTTSHAFTVMGGHRILSLYSWIIHHAREIDWCNCLTNHIIVVDTGTLVEFGGFGKRNVHHRGCSS